MQKYLEVIKSINPAIYDPKTKIWEVPITSLKKLLQGLSKYDSIQLTLLQDDTKDDNVFKLSKYKTKPFKYQLDGIQLD